MIDFELNDRVYKSCEWALKKVCIHIFCNMCARVRGKSLFLENLNLPWVVDLNHSFQWKTEMNKV